ncbi:hypothetical protein RJ55_04901 [Drechmeria coniospora]|nr:hypothetical protein RJ55_04901 [Drechmeria coniospora]
MNCCKACNKSPPSVNLKRCAKCSITWYCSRDCQKVDWKEHKKTCAKQRDARGVDDAPNTGNVKSPPKGLDRPIVMPFTHLENGTWLHDRPEMDVYRLLIDAYRMYVEDLYQIEQFQEEGSIYTGAPDGLSCFQRFLTRVESRPNLLPPWWNGEKRQACESLGMDASQWCDLRCAVEKSDIIDHYGDPRFPMQLRMFAELVNGRGPGGSNGTAMRKVMVAMEQGTSQFHASTIDATTGKVSKVRS